MENHALDPITVLKVKFNCCKECPEKLKKALLEIKGVHQVALDPEKNRVCIRGDINPFKLVRAITKWGKNAELVFYDKEPMNEDERAENDHMNGQKSRYKNPNGHCHNAGQNGQREKEKYSFCSDDDNDEDGEDEDQDGHYDFHFKMEDSVHNHKYRAAAEGVEEEMNWDRYGRFHNSTNGCPSWDSDHINHPHQHKDPSREDTQAFIKQAEEDLRRIQLCREYRITRNAYEHARGRYW